MTLLSSRLMEPIRLHRWDMATVTNDKIYDLVDKLRIEMNSNMVTANANLMTEIRGLRTDFTTLERGRLTRAEGNINDLRLQVQTLSDNTSNADKTLSNRFVLLGSIGMVLLSTFLSALFLWLFTKETK